MKCQHCVAENVIRTWFCFPHFHFSMNKRKWNENVLFLTIDEKNKEIHFLRFIHLCTHARTRLKFSKPNRTEQNQLEEKMTMGKEIEGGKFFQKMMKKRFKSYLSYLPAILQYFIIMEWTIVNLYYVYLCMTVNLWRFFGVIRQKSNYFINELIKSFNL